MIDSGLEFILSEQNNDGGWGYHPGEDSSMEPTAAAMISLRDSEADSVLERAIQWVLEGQNADGGWGINSQDDESNWHTAWVIFSLKLLEYKGEALDRGLEWLRGVDTARFSDEDKEIDSLMASADHAARTWPWLPGEATWIEPTALAMLALVDDADHPVTGQRLNDALVFFQERRCPGGGWNVGNPVMFDSSLPARAHPTAWVLFALSNFAPEIIHDDDLEALRIDMYQDGGSLALAWGVLAQGVLGYEDTDGLELLLAQQDRNGSWGENLYHTAVALMAIRGYS
jgi:hypothetical protein